MATEYERKVVVIKFDNKDFEKKVKATTQSVDELNKTLEPKNLGKAYDDVSKTIEKTEQGALKSGLHLKNIALKYIKNIEDSIASALVRTSKRIVSSLTIDPVKTGLQEYETKLRAIQVIKSNTQKYYQDSDWIMEAGQDWIKAGKMASEEQMKDITSALDELNKYADKTIYNFAQMTDNVGKFVAQGLTITKATKAVQGMANLAAASGASPQDMARATFQMSQALGGTIRSIDWRSLMSANMATQTLKQTLQDVAAVEANIDVAKLIKDKGTFEKTLETGWLTGDLFTEAMNIYSGVYSDAELQAKGFSEEQIKNFQKIAREAEEAATKVRTLTQLKDVLKETAQSGWTETWTLITGEFDEATKLWTAISNTIGGIIQSQADKRNSFLRAWRGEYEITIEEIDSLGKVVLDENGKAKTLTKTLNSLTEAEKKYLGTEKLEKYTKLQNEMIKGRDEIIAGLKNLSIAAGSLIKPIKEAWTSVFDPLSGQKLAKLSEQFKNFTSRLILSEEGAEKVKKIFTGVFKALSTLMKIFRTVYTVIKKTAKALMAVITNVVIKPLKTIFTPVIDSVIKLFTFIADKIGAFADKITNAFKKTNDAVEENSKFIENVGNMAEGVADVVAKSEGVASSAFGKIKNIFEKSHMAENWEKVKNFFIKIGEFFKKVYNKIKPGLEALKNMLVDIGEKLANAFNKIAETMSGKYFAAGAGIAGVVAIIIFIRKLFKGLKSLFSGAFGIQNAARIIATAISEIFSSISLMFKDVSRLAGAAKGALKANMIKNVGQAILMITISILLLSQISEAELKRANAAMAQILVFLGSMIAVLTLFTKTSTTIDKVKKTKLKKGASLLSFLGIAAVMVSIAIALISIVGALAILGNIDQEKLEAAWESMVGIFAMLYSFMGFIIPAGVAITKDSKTAYLQIASIISSVTKLILLIVLAMAILTKINIKNPQQYEDVFGDIKFIMWLIVGLLGAILATTITISFGKATTALASVYKTILAITLMLGTIVASVLIISKYATDHKKVGFALATIAIIFIEILSVLGVITAASRKEGSIKSSKIIPMLWAITGIVVVIAATITGMAHALDLLMDPNSFTKAVGSISGILFALVFLMAQIQKFAQNKKGTDGKNLESFSVSRVEKITLVVAAIVAMASSIGVLLVGMAHAIDNLKDANSFLKASVALLVIMAALVSMMAGVYEFSKKIKVKDVKTINSIIYVLYAFVGLIAATVAVMTLIQNSFGSDWKMFGRAGAMFGIMFAAISGIFVALSEYSQRIKPSDASSMKNVIIALYAIVGLVATVSEVLKLISSIGSWTNFGKYFGMFGAIFAGLSVMLIAVAAIAKEIKKGSVKADIFVVIGVIGAIIALIAAVIGITKIANISFDENLEAVAAIAGILVIILGFITTLAKTLANTNGATQAVLALSAGITAIVLALTVLVIAIQNVGSIAGRGGDIAGSFFAVFTLFVAIGLMMIAFAQAASKDKDKMLGLVAFAAAVSLILLSLSAVLVALGYLQTGDDIANQITQITVLISAIMGILVLASALKLGKKAIEFSIAVLLVAGALVAIAGAMIMFNSAGPDSLWNAIGALSALIVVLTAVGAIVLYSGIVLGIMGLAGSILALGTGLLFTALASKIFAESLLIWYDALKTIIGDLPNFAKEVFESFKNIGSMIITGIGDGIKKGWETVKDKVKEIWGKITGQAKESFDIHSPSRVFKNIGILDMKGLSAGLEDGLPATLNTMDSVFTSIKDDAADEASGINSMLSNILGIDDNTFVITPVLDLSQIQNEKGRLNSILSGNIGIGVSSSYAAAVKADSITRTPDTSAPTVNNNDSTTNYNTFYVDGSIDPEETATQISRILQERANRKSAVFK